MADDKKTKDLFKGMPDFSKKAPAGFTQVYKKCHEDHPVLQIAKGELVGGACNNPRKKFDIYVGLDHTMATHTRSYPWAPEGKRTIRIHFPIRDRETPVDVEQFHLMVGWLCSQLQEGKRVHIGCIGGHGRTGLVIAAIMAQLGEADPIKWTRENHCQRAVESDAQVRFLVKEFGAKPAKAVDRKVKKSKGSTDFTPITDDYTGPSYKADPVKLFSPAPSNKNFFKN